MADILTARIESYAERIRLRYPEIVVEHARLHTTEGQFNEILFVNQDLVFRFPRSAEVAETLARSAELLQRIRPYLSLAIPDPRYAYFDSPLSTQAFLGYPLLPGRPLWPATLEAISSETVRDRLAGQLARFLQELHRIPVDVLGPSLPVDGGPEAWRQLYLDFRTHLFPYMRPEAQMAVTQTFDRFLNDPRQFNYTPTLCHGDFGPGNILYSAASQAISGILDFDSVGLGDPAADAGAILNLGEDFFSRMCRTYPALADMRSRTEFYRSTYALQEALYGLRDNVPEAIEAGLAAYR